MKKIKIIRSRPLKEEEEVIDQQPDAVTEPKPEITFESNPLEFMLLKYPSLEETLVELLTEDFRDYLTGIYIMAPKPTIFKIVLHNNQYFYLTWMGKTYEAKVSGKKYYLSSIGDLQRATIGIAELLMKGAPPQAAGPDAETTSASEPAISTEEEVPTDTTAEETPEEIAEGKKGLGITLIKEDTTATRKELKKLGYKDTDMIDATKNQIKLLVPGKTRLDVIKTLVSKLKYKWDKDYKGSSIGAVIAKDGTVIIPKPVEKQGGGGAGLGNEAFIANKINATVEEVGGPITVVIKAKNKSIKYNRVDAAKEVGRDTSGGKKSDIKLLSGEKTVGNLSLKQENAGMWESADKRYKDLMVKLVNKLRNKPYANLGLAKSDKKDIFRLYNPKTKQEYSGIIITGLNKDDIASICFGTDNPKTVVVKETFDDSDFELKGTTLTVTVHGLLTDIKDIEGTNYEPVLVIRHDSTRTATSGLRPIIYTKEKVYKDDAVTGNRIELPFDKIK
jgi:hypothetical protein